MRLLGQLVALALFFAIGEQADTGRRDAEDGGLVGGAHQRELQQPLRLAVGVGADVEQHHLLAARRREDGAERWTVDTLGAAEGEHRGGHHRAAVAGGDGADGLAVAHELLADA